MSASPSAETWHAAMKRARQLQPERIASAIVQTAPTGLKATRYDSDGGRTSRVECNDETCEDFDPEGPPHSHHVVNDPTGNAATRGRGRDSSSDDLRRLNDANVDFIRGSAVVLGWVCGKYPDTWEGVLSVNATLMPGTVQAGLDVDHDGNLYKPIGRVDRAVSEVERIAREYQTREPSTDERHWTSGLGPNDVCSWHVAIHERYRRPRVSGLNICADCVSLSTLLGQKPPQWLIEAQVDYEGRPVAWRAALSRCMDELGVTRESA